MVSGRRRRDGGLGRSFVRAVRRGTSGRPVGRVGAARRLGYRVVHPAADPDRGPAHIRGRGDLGGDHLPPGRALLRRGCDRRRGSMDLAAHRTSGRRRDRLGTRRQPRAPIRCHPGAGRTRLADQRRRRRLPPSPRSYRLVALERRRHRPDRRIGENIGRRRIAVHRGNRPDDRHRDRLYGGPDRCVELARIGHRHPLHSRRLAAARRPFRAGSCHRRHRSAGGLCVDCDRRRLRHRDDRQRQSPGSEDRSAGWGHAVEAASGTGDRRDLRFDRGAARARFAQHRLRLCRRARRRPECTRRPASRPDLLTGEGRAGR